MEVIQKSRFFITVSRSVKVPFPNDRVIYSKKDTWVFSLFNNDSNHAQISKKDACDKELKRLGERMPIGQYIDLSILRAREKERGKNLRNAWVYSFRHAQSEKTSSRRQEPIWDGENRAFSVYSQKSVFSEVVSILSIFLPKFDQPSKRRAHSYSARSALSNRV